MSKITFLPEDLSGHMVSLNNMDACIQYYSAKVYIQASALQKCAKRLPSYIRGNCVCARQMSEYVKDLLPRDLSDEAVTGCIYHVAA